MPEHSTTARIALKVLPETLTRRSECFALSWRSVIPGSSFRGVTIQLACLRRKALAVPGKRFAEGGERSITSGQRIWRWLEVSTAQGEFAKNSIAAPVSGQMTRANLVAANS